MKCKLLALALLATTLYSCQRNSEKKLTEDAGKDSPYTPGTRDSAIAADFCKLSGSGNFLISQTDGEKMMGHFRDIYTKDVNGAVLPGVQLTFWVPACGIAELSSLLYSNDDYDGVRIVFAANDNANKSTHFYFVPTTKTTDPKRHTEDWNYTINLNGCTAKKYFSKFQDAIANIQRYGKEYGEKPVTSGTFVRDSLSEKCWIDRCVIRSLSDILSTNSSIVDGINVNLAAYEAMQNDIGQHKPNQSTIVLVPSRKISHTNVWEINKYYIENKNLSAYNHSQLCPQICL